MKKSSLLILMVLILEIVHAVSLPPPGNPSTIRQRYGDSMAEDSSSIEDNNLQPQEDMFTEDDFTTTAPRIEAAEEEIQPRQQRIPLQIPPKATISETSEETTESSHWFLHSIVLLLLGLNIWQAYQFQKLMQWIHKMPVDPHMRDYIQQMKKEQYLDDDIWRKLHHAGYKKHEIHHGFREYYNK